MSELAMGQIMRSGVFGDPTPATAENREGAALDRARGDAQRRALARLPAPARAAGGRAVTDGFVGIDLGTSAVKVLVQDADGRAVAKASRPMRRSPPGRAGPSSRRTRGGPPPARPREAVADSGARIRSVGLSGQLNGFVLAGADGAPLGPAMIWLDLRAESEAQEIAAAEDFAALTGHELGAIAVLPKLAWFRRHRPDVLDGAARVLMIKDWVRMRLTGEIANDPSDAASTAMAIPDGSAWVEGLLSRAGIPGDRLPPIRPSTSIAGRVTPAAAEATGLPAGTPVAVGAGDVTALAVGCGIVAPGRVAITLGTAGHVVAQTLRPGSPAGPGLWRLPHAFPGATLLLGLIMSGGLSLAWLRQSLAAGREAPGFDARERLAAAVPAGSRGVTFLPFREGAATSQRCPDARGAFLGLSSAHGTGELGRAVVQAVAFNAVECVEALVSAGVAVADIRLAEGGAQSPPWCVILAEALGRPVTRVAERDTSAAGAALIGRAALEGEPLREMADRCCILSRRFDPLADRKGTAGALNAYRARVARLLS
jgi:xylulokinase